MDDPRLPTLKGPRRRGYTPSDPPSASTSACPRDAVVEMQLLEHFIREDLNKRAVRVLAVLKPLKVVIDNHLEQGSEELDAVNNPEDASAGTRSIPFSRRCISSGTIFLKSRRKNFSVLHRDGRFAFVMPTLSNASRDEGCPDREVTELHCTYDPQTKSGGPDARRKARPRSIGSQQPMRWKRKFASTTRCSRRIFECATRPGLDGLPEPAVSRMSYRMPSRAEPQVGRPRPDFNSSGWAILALTLTQPRSAGVQSHGIAQRRLG